MQKDIFDFICKIEGYKTALKNLHWDAINLSQHRLCDDIASDIADIQDTVSEIQQSIDGNLKINKLKGTPYKIKDLAKFIEDVISDTKNIYKSKAMNDDNHIGVKSEIEAFLAKMQKYIYLNKFCLNEDRKRALKNRINESMKPKTHNIGLRDLSEMILKAANNVIAEKRSIKLQKNRFVKEDIDRLINKTVRELAEGEKKEGGYNGIHIKKSNEGKFTKTKEETGKSTEELTHSKNPLTRKRAIFAQNVKKWNHKKN
jgi:hypothetical protein